jgi:protein-S-isoprenylcysteine O-methyltransferase
MYIFAGLTNPQNLSFDSYLVNHSLEYGLAAAGSWLEFWLESWLLGGVQRWRLLSLLGLAICLIGELVRRGYWQHVFLALLGSDFVPITILLPFA